MPIRDLLDTLPFVVVRRLSAREGYFTAGRMFALAGESTLWLRLPVPASAALLEADRAHPLVGPAVPTGLTWVAVPLDNLADEELRDLIASAHQSVRAASRKARRDRSPSRRRRARASA